MVGVAGVVGGGKAGAVVEFPVTDERAAVCSGTRLGNDADEVLAAVTKKGITRQAARQAMDIARERGSLTIWSMVDALTRLAQQSDFAGDRTEADAKASSLLELVSA